MPKHVLLYTDEPGVGGVAQYNHAILLNFIELGYKTTCVQSQVENPLVEQRQQHGVHHEWLPFDTIKRFDRTLTNAEDATTVFQHTQPDLILFSDACPISNFAAKQAAIELNIPYVVVVGFVDPDLAQDFDFCLNGLAQQYEQAQAVIAVSQENLHLLHQLFRLPEHQGEVIHYGRPVAYFASRDRREALEKRLHLRQELSIPSDAIVCFTAARLDGIKGYQIQLDAIARLKETPLWSNLYFLWAGEGPLRATLTTAIETLEFGDRVKLLGQRWDMPDWYDAADIFVFPSYLEGMPLAIMEAMAKGLPVMATAVSGVPEELGDTGKLLPDPKANPDGTIAELVTTLQIWAEDVELRQAIGRAGKDRAEQLFRVERMLAETLSVIDRALITGEGQFHPRIDKQTTAVLQTKAADHADQERKAERLIKTLRLRSQNLILFPDWSQPEDQLFPALAEQLKSIFTHPDCQQMTVLIDASDVAAADAGLALSSLFMHLLSEEAIELSDETAPEVSLVPPLSHEQWQQLLPHLTARISLDGENQAAIARSGADRLPEFLLSEH
jgi:glycosyltransferase involved in cell wall biosynthesis